jgi:hypothetical protein
MRFWKGLRRMVRDEWDFRGVGADNDDEVVGGIPDGDPYS